MSKYKELMDKLGEASLEIEGVLDDFPTDQNTTSKTDTTLQGEREILIMKRNNWGTIENLLLRYQEQRVRLYEVGTDDEDGRDDAVAVGSREPTPFGLMSQTSTHYQFNTPAPPGLPIGHERGWRWHRSERITRWVLGWGLI